MIRFTVNFDANRENPLAAENMRNEKIRGVIALAKNIGIVKWFISTRGKNYGLIKFLRGDNNLSPDDEIYFLKSDFVSTAPRLNDFVSFNLKSQWQERNVNCWRVGNVTVLNWNDLPTEMILTYWDKLNVDNKRAAFVKYFDALPADKLADMAKDLPPAEFVDSVIDKRTFTQKISAIIERSNQKFYWALYLLGNVTLFRKIKVGEDVMIFFVYEWVKREKPLNKLVDLLQEKRDAINASLYAKIVCLYICAAHERNIGSGRHKELMNRAQKAVAEIFNRRVDVLKSQSQNPAEIVHFDYPEAHILPPCENPRKICSFCEAIVWLKKFPTKTERIIGRITAGVVVRKGRICLVRDFFLILIFPLKIGR